MALTQSGSGDTPLFEIMKPANFTCSPISSFLSEMVMFVFRHLSSTALMRWWRCSRSGAKIRMLSTSFTIPVKPWRASSSPFQGSFHLMRSALTESLVTGPIRSGMTFLAEVMCRLKTPWCCLMEDCRVAGSSWLRRRSSSGPVVAMASRINLLYSTLYEYSVCIHRILHLCCKIYFTFLQNIRQKYYLTNIPTHIS